MRKTFKTVMSVIRLCSFFFLGVAIYLFASDGQMQFAAVCVSLGFSMLFVFTMLDEIYEKVVKR